MTTQSSPIEKLYDMRRDFTIIGLTGVAGSGCSTLAKIMSNRDFLDDPIQNEEDRSRFFAKVRIPDIISVPVEPPLNNEKAFGNNSQRVNEKITGATVFKRKYGICYNFAKQQYKPYTIVKYTHIIWLYGIIELYREQSDRLTVDSFKEWLQNILEDKFQPSTKYDGEFKSLVGYSEEKRQSEIKSTIDSINCESVVNGLKSLQVEKLVDYEGWKECKIELRKFIQEGSPFNYFLTDLLGKLGGICIYSLSFLHHRMAGQIRKVGSLKEKYNDIYDKPQTDYSPLYVLAQLLNVIIKGYQKEADEKGNITKTPTCIVIDSVRNSQEAQYLKERYSAFYLVAVHDTETFMAHLNTKVKKGMPDVPTELVNVYAERLRHLSYEESKQKDFEKTRWRN